MSTFTTTPSKPTNSPAPLTDALVRELRERLRVVLAAGNGKQQVVIHSAPGRKSAKLEWPPGGVEVKA